MRRFMTLLAFVPLAFFLTSSIALGLDGDDPKTPVIRTVDPLVGKAGDVVTAGGEFLGKQHVAEIYLTNGTKDFKLEVASQADDAIKFKVPPNVEPGKYALMVLTARKTPNLIEQPVSFTVQ